MSALGGFDYSPWLSKAITGNPSIPDLGDGNTFDLVFRQRSSGCPFLTSQYKIDEFVSEFDTVAKAGKIRIPLGALISNRPEITLPECVSNRPV